jgi:transcriptional regulator with XRE-family HTH domain
MRVAQKLTLRELAHLADVSHTHLAAVERGERRASSRWMRAVLEALADHLRGDDVA